MACPEENAIVDYVRGDASPVDRDALERHFDECASCFRVVGDLARIFEQPVDGPSGSLTSSDLDQTSPATLGDPNARDVAWSLGEGSRLGRYVVLSRIGAGGMGVVYAAYDPELDRKVAIKLLRGSAGGSVPKEWADQRARLLREAQAMAKLSHPNVITVHDVGTIEADPNSGPLVFLAMEFVDGTTLSAWMKERKRSWREVLHVLLAAGRGLAAAHAVGLVHRDFKPDNVLLGRDPQGAHGFARVLVTDFGLARPAAGKTDAFASVAPVAGTRALGLALTQTGALVGTPAFMAPEQLAGERSDAQSDQFSFCVTAYDGLYRERPFAGRVLSELIANVGEGRVRPPPRDATVPRWIRRALLRGLSVKPEDRYASMDELLLALGRNPWRRWQQAATFAVPAALLGVAVYAYDSEPPVAASYCRDVRDKLDDIWDESRRDAIGDAFGRSALPYAADAWAAVQARLDPYAERWVASQTQVCRDEIEGARPAAVIAMQMTCLDRRREALRAFSDILATADAGTIERAVDAADALPQLDICDDIESLMLRETAHDAIDPEAAREIDAALSRAKVLRDAAKYSEARALAESVITRARELGYQSAMAQALGLVASADDLAGRIVEAESEYHDALSAALASGSSEVIVAAAIGLIWITGDGGRPMVEADRWYAHGKGALERLGGDSELGAELERAIGIAYLNHGDPKRAETHVRASLEIREQAQGADHPAMGSAYGALGQLLSAQGRSDEARSAFERAAVLVEKEYGPSHPNTAAAIDNLGAIHGELGEHVDARNYHERALLIRTAALGADNPVNASTHHNLASALSGLGMYDEALMHARRELEIFHKVRAPDHPEIAQALSNLGHIELAMGDAAASAEHYAQALAIARKSFGEDNLFTALYAHNYGSALRDLGRDDEARELLEHALAVREAQLGPDHPRVGFSLIAVSQLRLHDGDEQAAVELAERAVSVFARARGETAGHAEARLALVRALWARARDDDRTRARALADAVLVELRRSGTSKRIERELETWLAEHPER
ncbi:MAG TPA: serine/threonine-protein kinase [Nannocystaceae bacterium]|nr:serine/threonine-protein kinase [Nannocystaceae bacterium]